MREEEARGVPAGDGHGCSRVDDDVHRQQDELEVRMQLIRHKLLVLSGKGSVGKSTVAVNLATALAAAGRRVAGDAGVPFLGRIPMDPAVVQAGERGGPHVEAFADSPTAAAFSTAIEPLLTLTERPAPTHAVPVAGGAGAPDPSTIGTDG